MMIYSIGTALYILPSQSGKRWMNDQHQVKIFYKISPTKPAAARASPAATMELACHKTNTKKIVKT